jgi:SHS2 domain-containing protein
MLEILDHPADLGFRVRGNTMRELFGAAAEALMSVAVVMESVTPRSKHSMSAHADDPESLLVNWLSEVLYWLDGKKMVFRRFVLLEAGPTRVRAEAFGEPRDPSHHRGKIIVKGITYHQLKLWQDETGWWADIYLDI